MLAFFGIIDKCIGCGEGRQPRLYDTILDDLNTQIFMLENESIAGGGLNLTSL